VRVTGQFAPLLGILIGALGGAIYWLAVQIWPSSVAVILSMAATALLTTEFRELPATRLDLLGRVLCLLVKYNALMALSAAKLPFAASPNVPLALIMVCGYAASFALPNRDPLTREMTLWGWRRLQRSASLAEHPESISPDRR